MPVFRFKPTVRDHVIVRIDVANGVVAFIKRRIDGELYILVQGRHSDVHVDSGLPYDETKRLLDEYVEVLRSLIEKEE